MEKILNQEEIDALFRAAQRSRAGKVKETKHRKVTRRDWRQAGQISKEQVRSVSMLHETFARNITNSLGAYLRVGLEVNLVSVEQLTYAEFLGRLPDLTYLASLAIRPLEAVATIQMELSLAFPMMDLVLGGQGKSEIETRDLTEIEEQILESVVRILCKELQATWLPVLGVEFEFGQRHQQAQVQALMLPSEKILSLSFEIRIPEARGTLNLAFPAVVSNALLRKLSLQWSYYRRSTSPVDEKRLQESLLDSTFALDLGLPPSGVRVRELVNLQAGQVLPLQHSIEDPVHLSVAGKTMFLAYPIGCGNRRGAHVQRRLSIVGKQEKEPK